MIIAGLVAVVIIGIGIVLAGWGEDDFLYAPPFGAVIVGTIATSITVSRLVDASKLTDVILLNAVALLAFGLGAAVGFYVGFLISLSA